MGDIANMTSCHGEVSGPRLLRWLRSREAVARKREEEFRQMGEVVMVAWSAGRRELLESMADDLEAELTPPDLPEDDGEEPERPCPNCLGAGEVQMTVPNRGLAYHVCGTCNGTGKERQP